VKTHEESSGEIGGRGGRSLGLMVVVVGGVAMLENLCGKLLLDGFPKCFLLYG
jgi:hypothetical protein